MKKIVTDEYGELVMIYVSLNKLKTREQVLKSVMLLNRSECLELKGDVVFAYEEIIGALVRMEEMDRLLRSIWQRANSGMTFDKWCTQVGIQQKVEATIAELHHSLAGYDYHTEDTSQQRELFTMLVYTKLVHERIVAIRARLREQEQMGSVPR
jgi:hypothetical protein